MRDELQENVSALWERPEAHFFVSEFSKWMRTYSPRQVALAFAKEISKRLPQKYDSHFHFPLLGLQTALKMQDFFQSKSQWLPLGQVCWFGVCEAAFKENDLKKILGTPPLPERLNFETFQEIYTSQNFKEIFPLIIFLMRNAQDRKKVFSYVMSQALADESHQGLSPVYLSQTWQFCESMKWESYADLWFPPLHFILTTPSHLESYPLVEVFYNQNWKELLTAIQKDDLIFPKDHFENFKAGLYNDDRQMTLEKILRWIKEGQSLKSLFEVLKLISSDIAFESSFGMWMTALQPLIYVEALESVIPWMDPQDQIKALLMSALMVKKGAILSKPFKTPVIEPLKTIDEKNCPQFFLEYYIRRGHVSRALGALDEMVQTQRVGSLILELLAFCASKNNAAMMFSLDLQFAYAALHSCQKSNHPLRFKYVQALVKLLAEQPKNPKMYQALCNTQQIRLGYFSVEGDFNF